jgi:N-(2-amino-2-carboxyethyl)-L-glutamate synthase
MVGLKKMKFLNSNRNTPLIKVELEALENIQLYSKLEFLNPTGSVKDRAASFILRKVLKEKIINQDTMIIESSSGNFGVALAAYCKKNPFA